MYCHKCRKLCGVLLLIFGILFAMQNVGYWDFWNLQWYTIAFLLLGLGHLASAGCADCKAMLVVKKR